MPVILTLYHEKIAKAGARQNYDNNLPARQSDIAPIHYCNNLSIVIVYNTLARNMI